VNLSRLLKCLSLANLIFLPAWVEMMPGAGQRYYMGYSVGVVALAALGISILLTALVLQTAYLWLEDRANWWGRLLRHTALFLVTGLAINGLRVGLPIQAYVFDLANQVMQLGWARFLLLYGSPFVLLALFIHFKEARFSLWGARLLLVLCPLPLVTGSNFFTTPMATEALPPANGIAPIRPKGLTVYMIFDEWDYNWTYPYRPAEIPLPELDRFGRENLFFTRAYAPTSETFRSIPSLLTGRVVEAARTRPGPDALLKFRGDATWTPWSRSIDLPYQLGKQGLRTCFITHYHAFGAAYTLARPTLEIRRKPYFKEWEEGRYRYRTFAGSMLRQARCVLENIPGVNFLMNHEGKVQSVPTAYLHALDETLAALRSRRFDAIIVHWPIPHAPVLVDPTTGEFTANPPKGLRLTENLRLLDGTLRRVRAEMEDLGLWKDATVVLTSDHWQRLAADGPRGVAPSEPGIEASHQRVPLLIKWPGAPTPQRVDDPVNGAGVATFLAAPEESRHIRLLQQTPGGHLGSYSPWIR
jgi:hypothetical protein